MHQNSSAMIPPILVSPFAIVPNIPVIGMIKQEKKNTP